MISSKALCGLLADETDAFDHPKRIKLNECTLKYRYHCIRVYQDIDDQVTFSLFYKYYPVVEHVFNFTVGDEFRRPKTKGKVLVDGSEKKFDYIKLKYVKDCWPWAWRQYHLDFLHKGRTVHTIEFTLDLGEYHEAFVNKGTTRINFENLSEF